LKREGRILPDRGWSYYTLLDVTFQPDCMTVNELEHSFRQAIAQVYSVAASRQRNAIRRTVWQRNPSFRKSIAPKPVSL
jgi:hypothetical protein